MAHQYPGQQPAYAPNIGFQPPQQPQVTVVSAQLGETPARMMCPNCRNEIVTSTNSECSVVQHIAFFVMCMTGVCSICSCLPYCISSLGNIRHECPQCHTHLGSYKSCN